MIKLLQKEFNVYTIDLPNQGCSSGPANEEAQDITEE
jgi:hypothetical protein